MLKFKIMRFSWVTFLLSMSALLSGCATTMEEYNSKTPLDKADSSRYGVVFAAVGTQVVNPFSVARVEIRPKGQGGRNLKEDLAKRPNLYRAYFKYEGDKLYDLDIAHNTKGVVNFSGEDEKGTLLAAALPSGEYEFYGFFWTWGNFYASTKEYFSVPFQLRPGEALYLGRYIARLSALKEEPGILFDTKTPEKAMFEARNEFSLDSKLFANSGLIPNGFKLMDSPLFLCEKAFYVRCPRRPRLDLF
jgi:hypothetical protein